MIGFERTYAIFGKMIDVEYDLAVMNAMFAICIKTPLYLDPKRTMRRRNRANRYSRSPAWRFRARRERIVP